MHDLFLFFSKDRAKEKWDNGDFIGGLLLIGLCTYLTGGSDYQDMRLSGLERNSDLVDLLSLPNGVPSEDTFERVFKSVCPEELDNSLRMYGKSILSDSAAYFCSLIRGYWSIENQLHWHLDITFKEDACRARTGYASQNLSVLRKMALHIVSDLNDKLSIKKR